MKNWKLLAGWHNKEEYFIHIRNFEKILNHGLVFEKIYIIIKFN